MRLGRLRIKDIQTKKDKLGNNVEVLELVPAGNDPCRECGREPRRNGSSRCGKCSAAYAREQLLGSRLQRKIEEAKK